MAEDSETSAAGSSGGNWWNTVSTGSGSSLIFNILQQQPPCTSAHALADIQSLNWSSPCSIPTSASGGGGEDVDNLSSTITTNNNNTSPTISTMDSASLSHQELVDSATASLMEQHNNTIWSQVFLGGSGSESNFEEVLYPRAPCNLDALADLGSWSVAPPEQQPQPHGLPRNISFNAFSTAGSPDLHIAAQFDVGRIKQECPLSTFPYTSPLGVSLNSPKTFVGGDTSFKNGSFSQMLESAAATKPFLSGDERPGRWPSSSSCLSQSAAKASAYNFGSQVLSFSPASKARQQTDPSLQFYPDAKPIHTGTSQHRTMCDEARDSSTDTKRSSGIDQNAGADTIFKRPRLETSSTVPTFKVRKEKLGDRITALQQLVSPFGKTDTASVLLEAIGYIKFLQDQVQVLSMPYMKSGGTSVQGRHDEKGWASSEKKDSEEAKQDLRSRGLCLVPVSCTLHVANDNGADYWTPSLGGTYR